MTKRVLCIVLVTVAVLLGSCSQGSPSETSEIVYGLTLVPSGIDPHIHASAELGIPLRSVYDSLIYRDSTTLEFVPGLAESWEISPDGLTYTFWLRQDVVFHDGTPFNADAVRINVERVLSPEANSLKAAGLLGTVQRVEVVDDYTVQLILSAPYAPLLDGLSQPYLGMASPTALAQWDTATYQFHQVGTGPYRFVEYIVDDRLVLEKFDGYNWAPSCVINPGVPAVDRIVFRFFTDPATRTLALQSGEADIMGELLPYDAQTLSSEGLIDLVVAPIPGQPLQFLFNTHKSYTSSLEVRKALLFATDRRAIIQGVFYSLSNIAYGPLSSSTLYYTPEVEDMYAYNPEMARALMDGTGWLDTDGDGWRDADGSPIELIILVPPWGLAPEVAQLLESEWETTLQVKIRLQQVASFPLLVEEVASGNYHAVSLNLQGLDPVVLNSFFLSNGNRNWTGYASLDLDNLLIQAQTEADPILRANYYAQAQVLIMEQALVLPIREYTNLNGTNTSIAGLHFDPQGWFPYLVDLSIASP
nr:hypothetical protein [Anaerolineae bacterium]